MLNEMVIDSGKGLNVLITTVSGQDWQTFATWYSIWKNLPDATVAISCERRHITTVEVFPWTKRLKIPILHYNAPSEDELQNRMEGVWQAEKRKLTGSACLVVKPLMMTFDEPLEISDQPGIHMSGDSWLLSNHTITKTMDDYYLEGKLPNEGFPLHIEAKDSDEPAFLVSYKKGCGKWLNTSVGCPFSSAAGLVSTEMTMNEHRIIEMWKKMVPLYNAVM